MARTYKNRSVGGRRRKSARRGGVRMPNRAKVLKALKVIGVLGGAYGTYKVGHYRGQDDVFETNARASGVKDTDMEKNVKTRRTRLYRLKKQQQQQKNNNNMTRSDMTLDCSECVCCAVLLFVVCCVHCRITCRRIGLYVTLHEQQRATDIVSRNGCTHHCTMSTQTPMRQRARS